MDGAMKNFGFILFVWLGFSCSHFLAFFPPPAYQYVSYVSSNFQGMFAGLETCDLNIEFTDLWVFLSLMNCEGIPKLRRA